MWKRYHFEIPLSKGGIYFSDPFGTIEECVVACKEKCKFLGVDYDRRDVKLFYTDDFGDTYEECTEEGELAG